MTREGDVQTSKEMHTSIQKDPMKHPKRLIQKDPQTSKEICEKDA